MLMSLIKRASESLQFTGLAIFRIWSEWEKNFGHQDFGSETKNRILTETDQSSVFFGDIRFRWRRRRRRLRNSGRNPRIQVFLESLKPAKKAFRNSAISAHEHNNTSQGQARGWNKDRLEPWAQFEAPKMTSILLATMIYCKAHPKVH